MIGILCAKYSIMGMDARTGGYNSTREVISMRGADYDSSRDEIIKRKKSVLIPGGLRPLRRNPGAGAS